MEEEKRHAMSPKEVIEFFNYPKSTVYDQWKAWNSFKKNDVHRKKRSQSLGATRTDEFVTEVKRKMGCSKQTIANTINKDLGYSSYKKRKSRETQAWLLENLPYHWSPDLCPPSSPDCNPLNYFFWSMVPIVEEFTNMKKDVVAKACGRFRHRLEMVVATDGGYIEK
ncbi:Uncharacterized protein FKW44_021842 [Caligus rogercresseyi]|uniref:Uncharacterized protein n=1 Tax=Caligus rogercresseyi TaxID=217165 RepID=A0A7T8GRY3_CALRO|nr:Uncharacterized protein FKW44_021842 [Caligus rogercresseyi]